MRHMNGIGADKGKRTREKPRENGNVRRACVVGTNVRKKRGKSKRGRERGG